MSQSADNADADADEDVDVVLESIHFSCPPTIVDEQCKVNVIVGVSGIYKDLKCVIVVVVVVVVLVIVVVVVIAVIGGGVTIELPRMVSK
jgi:hypothetical protein